MSNIIDKIKAGTTKIQGITAPDLWWTDGRRFWIVLDLETQSTRYLPVDEYPELNQCGLERLTGGEHDGRIE